MRQHRLTHRGSSNTTTPPAMSTIPTSLSRPTLDHPESKSESHNRSTVLVRPPVARAYRFKKETSICGLTCSCCFHTILGTVRKRKVSDSGAMATKNNNVLTAVSANIVPDCGSDGKSSVDKKSECDGNSHTTESLSHSSENCESHSHENRTHASESSSSLSLSVEKAISEPSFSADRPVSAGFVTKQKDGEQVQIAAKAPRKRSSNAMPPVEGSATVQEDASCSAPQPIRNDASLQGSADLAKNTEQFYAISETPKITPLWKLRHRRLASECSSDGVGPSSALVAASVCCFFLISIVAMVGLFFSLDLSCASNDSPYSP
ncbi:hypothetical protein Y032_0125g1278 [Ancylostoma ceylanicum]|uniref:Transmembrane protein n=1 Tax=Ancylostoma ceylanicum TaxID=53326 RepID=A0A016T830_9BILA|nr:hypothetical protein Y032_0125g1278 [Ancylostoma ceylanicum]